MVKLRWDHCMSEILHLNLHREFFAAIANKQKRVEYRRQSRYWRKRLEERKYDAATAMRNKHLKCWWNFEVCAATEKAIPLTMPSVLDAY